MPVAGPFSQVTSARHRKRRLGDLEAVVATSLAECYEAQLQPDGSILLVFAGGVTGPPVEPDYKSDALRILWRMHSMQVPRRDMAYLLPDLDSPLSWADVVPWLNKLSEPTSRGILVTEGDVTMHGAMCDLRARVELLYGVRTVPAPHLLQPGAHHYTWVTIGVDGTNRWNRGYVRCALCAPSCRPTNLASWWLFESAETWKTVFALQNECDFDGQLRAAATAKLPQDDGGVRTPLFFLRADGKAHVLLAGVDGFAKQSPGAMVCHCCSKNRDTVLRRVGNAEVANAGIEGTVRFTGVFRDIPADQRIPDYGAHGVLRVCNGALSGTVGVLMAQGGMSRANTARLVQRVVNGAREAARTVGWGAEKANAKGHVRPELGAALHFVRARLWVPLLQTVGGEIGGHRVGEMEWVAVCHEWWEAFASMCKAAWNEDFLSGQEQMRLFRDQRTMGVKHVTLGWSKTLWTLCGLTTCMLMWQSGGHWLGLVALV